jgi:Ca2+:H+ antiporter
MAGITPLERILLLALAGMTAIAGIADAQAWSPVPRFVVATVALVGLAWLVSFATEEVGGHLGPGMTGALQATLANLPELFVVIFALNAGELVVAQTAIVGSMLANALLLLGIVIVVGARRSGDGVMRFSRRLPNDTITLLIVMLFAIVFTSSTLGLTRHALRGGSLHTVSIVCAACLLGVYAIWLTPYLRSDRGGEDTRERGDGEKGMPTREGKGMTTREGEGMTTREGEGMTTREGKGMTTRVALTPALVLLLVAGVGSAFVSEWFIDALRPAIAVLHISRPFAGLVIVAIAGNAVEHAASVVLAARGRFELAISVVKNSVAQIAGFLFPVLVIVSLALPTQLTFSLSPVYIGALALMTFAVWQVTGDGRASAFEGWALTALYVIVAVVAAYQ